MSGVEVGRRRDSRTGRWRRATLTTARFESHHSPVMRIHFVISILSLVSSALGLSNGLEGDVGQLFNGTEGRHTNNWAVLVDTSRYWFNYRVCRGPARTFPPSTSI